MENESYLGDGVYARWDGCGCWIYTSNGFETSEEIYIELDTLNSLNDFVANKLEQ
jgi:hypothetical protein